MRVNNKMRFMPLILILLLILMMAVPMTTSVAYVSPLTVPLGTASSFGVLAGSTITNTGATTVGGTAGGNIGLHPGTSITGDPVTVTGSVYLTDAVAEQAKVDLVIAYDAAVSRETDETITADLGGRTLTPGVYTSASSIGLTGTLILDGGDDPNAVFIFKIGSTLTTASASRIELINGAQACNVFWQVGSSATLGTNSFFVGKILALTSITANSGAVVQGQLLAQNGAVTLNNNTIINDACGSTTGFLTVTKVVQGPVNDMTLPDFDITVTGPNSYSNMQTIEAGSSYTLAGLVAGSYTVTEGELGGDWSVSGTDQYDVQVGAMTQVTITNTYTPADEPSSGSEDDRSSSSDDELTTGELTVRKVVSGVTGDMTLSSFEITVTGPRGFAETRAFDHGESYSWENLEPGTYTVTESRTGLSSEWTVSGEGTVSVRADQTALKTINNAYLEDELATGELTVTKVVSGEVGDMRLPLFRITVTGPRGFLATRTFVQGESYTWENLVPGVYTVTENRSGLSSEWTVSGEGTIQVTADQTALTTITNVYNADVEVVLGGAELPRTGGNPLIMILTGLMLSGMGLWLRKKNNRTNSGLNK